MKQTLPKIQNTVFLVSIAISLALLIACSEYQLVHARHDFDVIEVVASNDEIFESGQQTINIEGSHAPETKQIWNKQLKLDLSALFNQAISHSQNGELKQAIALYKKILSHKPNHQMAATNLGLSLKKSGDCQLAITYLKHALEITGSSRKGKVHALLGSCYADFGQYNRAISHYEQSIDYRPTHTLTWRRYADAQALAMMNYNDVVDTYNKAISLGPTYIRPVISKAQYQISRLDFNGAITTLKQYNIKSNSSKISIKKFQRQLLWAALETNQYNAALKALRKLQRYDKKNKTAVYQAFKHYIEGNYQAVLDILTTSKSDMNPEKKYLMILAQIKLKNYKTALTELDSLSAQPEYLYRTKLKTADILMLDSQFDNADKVYRILLQAPVYQTDIYYRQAYLAAKLNQLDTAEKLISTALEQQPHNLNYALFKTELYSRMNRNETALNMLEELSVQHPNNQALLRQWAKFLGKTKQISAAINIHRKLTAMDSVNTEDLFNYAELLFNSGRHQSAATILSQLLELDHAHIEGRYMLAKTWCQLEQLPDCHREAKLVLKLSQHHQGALLLTKKRI